MTTQTFTGKLVVQACCVCSITFGVPSDFDESRLADHKIFYCPAGHSQSYTGKTEAQKLRDELARTQQRLGWAESGRQAARDQAETAEYRRRAEKAAKTRIKNRIAKGVCPCCNRSFENLGRHMSGQHPDYSTEATS